MQQQSMEFGVEIVPIESIEGDSLKDRAIVFALDRIAHHVQRIHRFVQASFVIEDRAVELFLGSKVTKDHRFRDAGRQGDLFRGGAAEAMLGKKAHRHFQDLQAPVLARHANDAVRTGDFSLRFHAK